jgi:hypothetical protein
MKNWSLELKLNSLELKVFDGCHLILGPTFQHIVEAENLKVDSLGFPYSKDSRFSFCQWDLSMHHLDGRRDVEATFLHYSHE